MNSFAPIQQHPNLSNQLRTPHPINNVHIRSQVINASNQQLNSSSNQPSAANHVNVNAAQSSNLYRTNSPCINSNNQTQTNQITQGQGFNASNVNNINNTNSNQPATTNIVNNPVQCTNSPTPAPLKNALTSSPDQITSSSLENLVISTQTRVAVTKNLNQKGMCYVCVFTLAKSNFY